jgi:hypothetical protein
LWEQTEKARKIRKKMQEKEKNMQKSLLQVHSAGRT